MLCTASFDPGQQYRYRLSRIWQPARDPLIWIMMNPSTADARKDDPTIRKCITFSLNSGYGGIVVLNLFALRATKPNDLLRVHDPIGPENDKYIQQELEFSFKICCAWGNFCGKKLEPRQKEVLRMLAGRTLYCLAKNDNGTPGHPLYIHGRTEFKIYRGVE